MKKKLKDVISKEFKGLWGTDFSDDGIPVIKTNNMTYEGRIDFSDICIRNIPYKEAENNFLKKGDLIIEKSGGTKTHSVGYVNIFEGEDDKYVCNNFILPLRPNTELVFPKYLFWQLHGMYEAGRFSDCYNKTTGIQNLQKKTYFSKEINLPSKEEQIKIAVHLDKIQSAIDNKKQQLSLLDEAVKSEFVEMFGENPVESGKWKVEALGKIAEIGSSKRIFASEYVTSGIPFYRSKEIIELSKNLKPSVELFISKERYEELKNKNGVPEMGDILMTAVGTIGKFWEVNTDKPFYYKDGNLVYIRCKIFNSTFFRYILESLIEAFKQQNLVGSAYSALTIDRLKQMTVPMIELDLQKQFAAFVQQIDKSKFVVKQQIADLQELLDSKMQEYFS